MDNGHAKTEAELDNALALLDHELERLNLDEPIRVRAIGGYALIKHDVRAEERAFTVDIDTVTDDYSQAVQDAIATVAEKADLDPTWLNNDNLGMQDAATIEAIYDARWLPQETGTKNIDLAIADIPTLTRAKIIAADTADVSGRTQDGPDLASLLAHQQITSLAEFDRAYPDPYEDHIRARVGVARHFARIRDKAASPARPEISSEAKRKFDELGEQIQMLVDTAEDSEPALTVRHGDEPEQVVTQRGYFELVAINHERLAAAAGEEVSTGSLEDAEQIWTEGIQILQDQIEVGMQAEYDGPSLG